MWPFGIPLNHCKAVPVKVPLSISYIKLHPTPQRWSIEPWTPLDDSRGPLTLRKKRSWVWYNGVAQTLPWFAERTTWGHLLMTSLGMFPGGTSALSVQDPPQLLVGLAQFLIGLCVLLHSYLKGLNLYHKAGLTETAFPLEGVLGRLGLLLIVVLARPWPLLEFALVHIDILHFSPREPLGSP